jgi:hypothetical protein
MLTQVTIRTAAPLVAVASAVRALGRAFPGVPVAVHGQLDDAPAIAAPAPGQVVVPLHRWRAPDLDPIALDEAVHAAGGAIGDFALGVVDDPRAPGDLALAALQIVTRCQRHLRGGNAHSATPFFTALLERHRQLHDLTRPLVAADYHHALDTWRWVLRLQPEADVPVQAAALFHDVERLSSESEVRVEQHAADYASFKQAHAAAGARITAAVLDSLSAAPALIAQVAELVASHEHPDGDPERALLNDADALSFFSLNAPGFARYYGPAHTRKKVAYTLARLTDRGRAALSGIRHRADIAALIDELAAGAAA